MTLGQPGGGGRQYPDCTCFMNYMGYCQWNICMYTCYNNIISLHAFLIMQNTDNIMVMHLLSGHFLKRFVSKTPYLIQQTAIAPHITGTGVLAKDKSFWCCPLDRDLPSMGHIVVIINEISRHSEITDLQTCQSGS